MGTGNWLTNELFGGVDLISDESKDASFSDMTIGISREGMATYVEQLKAVVLVETIDKLNDVSKIVSEINAGWQGESRDRFIQMFNSARIKIGKDLEDEYDDLNNRLIELQNNFFEQDRNMIL